MSITAEAAHHLHRIAEPCPAGDKVKAAIGRATRLVSSFLTAAGYQPMTYGRCENLWRQEAKPWAEEMDAIRAAARAREVEEEARAELRTNGRLIARIEALEAALLAERSLAHREDGAAVVADARGSDRSLDRGRGVGFDALRGGTEQ